MFFRPEEVYGASGKSEVFHPSAIETPKSVAISVEWGHHQSLRHTLYDDMQDLVQQARITHEFFLFVWQDVAFYGKYYRGISLVSQGKVSHDM